jgi:Cu2+-exporting ATPase
VPADSDLRVRIDGDERAMCCPGCQAVAEAILAAGQENFYRVRSGYTPGVPRAADGFRDDADIYDLPEVQRQFVHSPGGDLREASLILEGVTCAACIWLIEQYLGRHPGIEQVRVNYATERALVRWDDSRISLAEILREIEKIGYRALPYDGERQQAAQLRQRRDQQRRLVVAGLFGMQVMMLSISLYAGAWSGIEREFEQLFRWLGLGLTLPVLLYSGAPFFAAAWRDILRRRIAMDLPVSLALGAAFGASAAATLGGSGEVYFDSVVMFVFFLTASRYFEGMARHRSAASIERLAQTMPLTANRLTRDGDRHETVAAASLEIGDRVIVRPGESVPADGEILEGHTAIDESLLSGESLPLEKQAGDRLFGGSINRANPICMRVTAVGADTALAEIQRSIERAQADKPPLARLADRVAARFIALVLLIAGSVVVYWWLQDPARWFEIALAVLIVSCPCALSLATPTALSATLGRMQSIGLLVRRAAALEDMLHVTHVVLDKTGTLTLGTPQLARVECNAGFAREQCMRIAACLERHSEHPFARALVTAAGSEDLTRAQRLENVAGSGLRARIEGQDYSIGNAAFVGGNCAEPLPRAWRDAPQVDGGSAVFLARADRVMAMFVFRDELREDAADIVESLRRRGKRVLLMSGDGEAAARRVAAAVGVDEFSAGLSPDGKTQAVKALQARGARIMMIGDGINDAPVLAAAEVSIAMGGATALARSSADVVLVANRLQSVLQALDIAARTRRIVWQNMCWALMYNFGAIPAAALGLVAPWLAAIGMSLSSLVVVLNALRLAR